MLGTASLWLGQSLFVFDFVFLVVGLPSIVSACFGFQDLVFGVLTSMLSFITRGRLHSFLISLRLPFPLYSCISLQLSSHIWWLSLSPCLPLEIWILFSFVYATWAWKSLGALVPSIQSFVVFQLHAVLFQLMLGTASPWLGQSLFVFDFVFLVAGLPSIVSARFAFIESLVALPFTMFATRDLDNVFVRVCYVGLEGYFWYRCAELVSWSFGPFYPEIGFMSFQLFSCFPRHCRLFQSLLFFLRFQLMLGTASPWLGHSLFVFDFVFLVVGLPSIVSARFGFQDLVFGVLTSMLSFITRGRLHSFMISLRLPFPLYSCISLQLSSHLWWLSLSPCLPFEIWIMLSFVYAMWAWKSLGALVLSIQSFVVFQLHAVLYALV
ncbi:hypothetical protein F2Q70_00037164 [Brassica cretica]|uniref:Uncharacterized protein n=1 Tax=Brassica cretica TaxID=69181 RepID=A0A8S9JY59_BRACR|nr:hypothetical protein F2Q70_00037164 [Brassica cretica]